MDFFLNYTLQIFRWKDVTVLKHPLILNMMMIILMILNYKSHMTKIMRISRKPSPVTIMIEQNNWRVWNVLNIWIPY